MSATTLRRTGVASSVAALLAGLCFSASQAQDTAAHADGWSRAEPQSLGVDAKQLDALGAAIRANQGALVDSLLIARCGSIVFDQRYPHDYAALYGAQARQDTALSPKGAPGEANYYDADWRPYLHGTDLHTMQSVTKSITSIVYGVAIERGDFKAGIDTPVLNYFKGQPVQAVDARKRHMTIRNLLTMRSGFDWPVGSGYTDYDNTSMRMELSSDWAKFVIDQPMANEPGSTFFYNDGAAALLAYVFQKETGQDLAQYADKFLFAPLGIHHTYWRRGPHGLTDAQGGLYLRSEDLAKIGLLYLHKGMWNGHQLVSADWVQQSLTGRETAPGRQGQYGYLWTIQPHGPAGDLIFAAHGFGGQGLLVDPKRNLIVVITGWSVPKGEGDTQKEVLERVVAATSDGSCPASE